MKNLCCLMLFCLLSINAQAQWENIGGQARDVGVGADGSTWVIGWVSNGGGNYPIAKWTGSFWQEVPGGAVRIAVAPNGNPWVVNAAGLIYRYNGSAWEQIGGQARDIGIGADGTVWVIGWTSVAGGYNIARWSGSSWQDIPGGAVRIAVDGTGQAWIVNSSGVIFRRQNNTWVALPGAGKDIGVGPDGTAWVIGTKASGSDYAIYKWTANTWQEVDGGATNISVGPGGLPWVVNSNGGIFRRQNILPSTSRVMTRFNPQVHGFKFVNRFTVPVELLGFNFGNFSGLCGGMAYAALDYFRAGITIPQQNYMPARGMPLYDYLLNRQQTSVKSNLDKWGEYGFNPGGARNREFFNWGLQLGSGRLGELQSRIDRGEPVPLGLQDCGNDCACPSGKCPGNHQVLAIGYEMGRYKGDLGANIEDLSIFVYDPNYPNRTMTLRPHVDGAMYLYREEGQENIGACRWRAYFTDMKYTRATPPVIPNNPNELIATFRTGGDDLRGGNDNVHLILLMRSGATVRFENVNDKQRWSDGSTQQISRPLSPTFKAEDLIGVRIETTFGGGWNGDNWNLEELDIRVKLNGVERIMFKQAGTPLFRFTGDQKVREFKF